MDANVAPTFWGTMKNIYKQQRRWGGAWKTFRIMLEGFRNDPHDPEAKNAYWTFNAIEGFHSWATNSLMIFALGWLPLLLGGRHFGNSLLVVQSAAHHALHRLAFDVRRRELGGV